MMLKICKSCLVSESPEVSVVCVVKAVDVVLGTFLIIGNNWLPSTCVQFDLQVNSDVCFVVELCVRWFLYSMFGFVENWHAVK